MFLVGGETKSVQPQAIVLNSGDVVIMSGASRLAYHGVPRIISPPPTTTSVPPSLSRLSLLEHLQNCGESQQLCQLGSPCGACGKESGRSCEQTPANDVTVSPAEVPPVAKRAKTEADRERGMGEVASGWCRQWTDMLREWPEFEQYISTSRINVNIRQVNTPSDHRQITTE